MIERHKMGMLLFVGSEAVFFGVLIATFLVHRSGPGADATIARLDVPLTALFSLALFASSATAWVAERRVEHGDLGGLRRWLLVTIALGLIFLAGQAFEYRELLRHGVDPRAGVFASAFFTLTGFHGLHVLGGLVALLVVWSVAGTRGFARQSRVAFAPVALYWHFVDAVWLLIFALIYLWTAGTHA